MWYRGARVFNHTCLKKNFDSAKRTYKELLDGTHNLSKQNEAKFKLK